MNSDVSILDTKGSTDLRHHCIPSSIPLVVDLCSGMGGLSYAAHSLGMEIGVGVDTNKDAIRTFARNFAQAEAVPATVGGAKTLEKCRVALQARDGKERPLVILSGPPCQGFSAAGSRDPGDKRNKVLLAVARAIKELQPRCALVENVEMLLSDKYGGRVRDFERHLNDGGFNCVSVVLNARDYGVPQNRSRTFFFVTRELLDQADVQLLLDLLRQPELTVEEAFRGLPAAEVRGATYDDEAEHGPVPNHLAMRHSSRVQKKISKIPVGGGPMSYRKLDPKKPAKTIFSGHRAPPAHYSYPRSITVREAARLQGFPDDFRIYGAFANQMMQVTNAVPPPLATAVLRVLAEMTGLPIRPHA